MNVMIIAIMAGISLWKDPKTNLSPVMRQLILVTERAVLEFFIAKIRICSRRKLRYWAIVPPLGSHSHGHLRNASSHQLHRAGCLPTLIWRTLDETYEITILTCADLISNQPTISMAFHDWQMNIKIWQTCGSSSKHLRGIASFIKKDKAICLPVGSVLCSSSVISF